MRRAVFLDRDGVLNRVVVRDGRPWSPQTLAEFEILPGVGDALAALRRAGFLLVVVTNQPDVGRGVQLRATVEAMHARLRAALPLDDIKVCYEVEGPGNDRYKPAPGMLLEAAREHGIDLAESYMVGDRWRDVSAGRAAGCFTILVGPGYDEGVAVTPDARCPDLPAAADLILGRMESLSPPRGVR